MRSILKLGLSALAIALAAPVAAQTPPDMKTYAASAEVADMIAKAPSLMKPGATLASQPIVVLAPYRANLEYRTGKADAAVHETDAELFYVIQGSGVLVMGGQMVNARRANAHNLAGDSIEGGQSYTLTKGDVLIVPQNTPHQVTSVDGALVLMTLHVPRQ
jgi:mannose-6-phosphate isomerase-like protein (cupin superfamily)